MTQLVWFSFVCLRNSFVCLRKCYNQNAIAMPSL